MRGGAQRGTEGVDALHSFSLKKSKSRGHRQPQRDCSVHAVVGDGKGRVELLL